MSVIGMLVFFGACATMKDPTDGYPNQRAILKKSRAQLVACAGPPLRELTQDDSTLLTYYKHTPMFDRSRVGSKSTVATPHYACWATVSLEQDVVTDVSYQSVPAGADASDQCEAIFDPCT